MKYLLNTITAISISFYMVGCSNGQTISEGVIAENVNIEAFEKHMDGAQLLDVRTPEEWNQGIIEGAIMYNFYDKGFENDILKLDKEKPVAVYCKSGGRSGKTMAQMSKLGFKEVYNLNGGMGAWQKASKPTVKP